VLRRIFGSNREELTGGSGRLHNEELHNLYASPNIVRVNILRRMGYTGRSTHGRDEKCKQYEGVSKSFRTVRLQRELQMVQLSLGAVVSLFCESV
jgi:hypothetical protein